MTNRTRIKVAAAVTTTFVGGLVAFGIASRDPAPPNDVAVVEAAHNPDPKVVHRRTVRTVHPKGEGAGTGDAVPAVVAPSSGPAVVQEAGPPQGSTRAASEDEDYDDEGEIEYQREEDAEDAPGEY